jgi:hypothetical protein
LPGLEQYEALTAFALWGKIGFAERPLNATPVPVAGNNVDWYPRGLRRYSATGFEAVHSQHTAWSNCPDGSYQLA